LHHTPDFIVAPNDRVDLPASRSLGKVASVFFQGLIFSLGILVGHSLRTAHLHQRLHQAVVRDAGLLE